MNRYAENIRAVRAEIETIRAKLALLPDSDSKRALEMILDDRESILKRIEA